MGGGVTFERTATLTRTRMWDNEKTGARSTEAFTLRKENLSLKGLGVKKMEGEKRKAQVLMYYFFI